MVKFYSLFPEDAAVVKVSDDDTAFFTAKHPWKEPVESAARQFMMLNGYGVPIHDKERLEWFFGKAVELEESSYLNKLREITTYNQTADMIEIEVDAMSDKERLSYVMGFGGVNPRLASGEEVSKLLELMEKFQDGEESPADQALREVCLILKAVEDTNRPGMLTSIIANLEKSG